MTPALAGLAIGLLAGVLNYVLLGKLSERVEKQETKKVLKIVGVMDLVVLPLLGLLIGTYIFG